MVIARVRFLGPDQGGRQRPPLPGYHPQIAVRDEFTSCAIESMKDEATDRLMRDPILLCNWTKGFVVLHHPMKNHRPVFSGKSLVRVSRPWSPFATHRRRAGVMGFIVSKQVLHLEIQCARRGKQEGKNW